MLNIPGPLNIILSFMISQYHVSLTPQGSLAENCEPKIKLNMIRHLSMKKLGEWTSNIYRQQNKNVCFYEK